MAEDPELERKLDAMFASAKPRRGFEDELWNRIQARRPWHLRLLGWFGAPMALRWASGVAVFLVLVAGGGYLLTHVRVPVGGGGANTAAGGASFAPRVASFGVLPRPAVASDAQAPKASGGGAPQDLTSGAPAYFSGTLPPATQFAPVYRYLGTARNGAAYAQPGQPLPAPLVGPDGDPTSRGALAVGSPSPLEEATYPVQDPAAALGGAGVRTGPAPAGGRAFDTAQVVYVVAVDADHGYYEPELLLTGPGGRILVPLIDPQYLSRT